MLLSAMLEVRAWALARPVSEQDAVGDALADRMEQVKRTEEEQGRFTFFGRHGIVDFIQAFAWVLCHSSRFAPSLMNSSNCCLHTEQTRLRLLNFISSIKSALEALTTGI